MIWYSSLLIKYQEQILAYFNYSSFNDNLNIQRKFYSISEQNIENLLKVLT